jgi:cytoskeletal protein RodZ
MDSDGPVALRAVNTATTTTTTTTIATTSPTTSPTIAAYPNSHRTSVTTSTTNDTTSASATTDVTCTTTATARTNTVVGSYPPTVTIHYNTTVQYGHPCCVCGWVFPFHSVVIQATSDASLPGARQADEACARHAGLDRVSG